MKLLNATYKILDQEPGLLGIYKQAELPGRICYGSQDRIAEGTAEPFCKGLMKSNHGAPLEHNGVYLDVPEFQSYKYQKNQYSKVYIYKTGVFKKIYADKSDPTPSSIYNKEETKYYVSTNLRVLFENGWMDDLQYLVEPTEFHEKRITVSFTVDRFTGEEFLRHRKASFNRESTRYVNFAKDKFGKGSIKFITPPWIDESIIEVSDSEFRHLCQMVSVGDDDYFSAIDYWLFSLKAAEYSYNNLIRLGWQPQQARTVLPCAINSPLIKTAFVGDWCHFFNLRALGTTGKPHPQAKELAEPLMMEFLERGLIKMIENPNESQRDTIPYICAVK